MRAAVNMLEMALPTYPQLYLNAVVKNNEVIIRFPKILQKERLAQRARKLFSLSQECFMRLIRGDQVEIKIGVGVCRTAGIGATEKSGHNAGVALTDSNKAIDDDLVGMG